MSATELLSILDDQADRLARALVPTVVTVQSGAGFGAGTIWRSDGLIVTNHHVLPTDRATVVLADGRAVSGHAIARDLANDLAVVAVEAANLPAAPRREARTLRAGELVFAVGHPFGVRHAISAGIVSAVEADPVPADPGSPGRRRLIRADVPIGPGSSGGPLVDAWGRVVGVNAMIGGGLALAVPADLADRLLAAALAYRAA